MGDPRALLVSGADLIVSGDVTFRHKEATAFSA